MVVRAAEPAAQDRIVRAYLAMDPERKRRFVNRLPPEQAAILERSLGVVTGAGWRADPWALARHLEGDKIEDWPYTRYLARQFRRAATGEAPRQTWNQPAQTGKTTWLWRGIAWALDFAPHRRWIYLSWSKAIAIEVSDFILQFSHEYRKDLRYTLRADRQARGRWLTAQGGGFLAASLGASAAGFGGSVIADDLIANWQQAHSPAARERAWSELTAVGGLRLAEDDCMIIAHTRWHLDDPTGRVQTLLVPQEGQRWEQVVLPMHARENDPLGRQPGEVLEPRRYSPEAARSRATLLGSYLAQALEEQDPQPEQGGEIKRDWWQWYEDAPRLSQVVTSWDMKLKDKAGGDYVVGLVLGRAGAAYYVLAMLRGQWTMRRTKIAIALAAVRYPQAVAHYVENTGNGPEVMSELRAGDPDFELTDDEAGDVGLAEDEREPVERLLRHGLDGLQPVNPKGDKMARARANSIPKIEAGQVYLPLHAHWPITLIDEHAAFPPKPGSGTHDDIVDALSQGLGKIGAQQATTAPPASGTVGRVPRGRVSGRRG